MTDVELLPLPEGERASDMNWDAQVYGRDEMHAYARANLAQLQAENERLRAEVERLRLRDAQINDLLNRALVDRKKADERAERLVEALRDARDFVAEALSDERAKFAGYEAASDIAGIEATLQKVDAALAQEDRNG